MRFLSFVCLILCSVAHAKLSLETFTADDGTSFRYALLLPDNFDATKVYPTLLALPPGDQTLEMVQAGLGYWSGGEDRGWVVVSPEAPADQLFYKGAAPYIPELLAQLKTRIKFEGSKVHVAGISNGGRSAFRLAVDYPALFHSLLGMPAFPPEDSDYGQLERLRNIPIALYAGENDSFWVENMLKTEKVFKESGGTINATVVPNEGHVIQGLNTKILFDLLDTFR